VFSLMPPASDVEHHQKTPVSPPPRTRYVRARARLSFTDACSRLPKED